jgi:hypothetical protein
VFTSFFSAISLITLCHQSWSFASLTISTAANHVGTLRAGLPQSRKIGRRPLENKHAKLTAPLPLNNLHTWRKRLLRNLYRRSMPSQRTWQPNPAVTDRRNNHPVIRPSSTATSCAKNTTPYKQGELFGRENTITEHSDYNPESGVFPMTDDPRYYIPTTILP